MSFARSTLVAALLCIGTAVDAAAQAQRFFDWTRLPFSREEYQRRRDGMIRSLKESGGGVFLAPSAYGVSGGETFRQLGDFLYSTGLEVPQSVLAIDADGDSVVLFMPARDPRFENPSRPNDFPGRPLADDPRLAEESGILHVRPPGALESFLRAVTAQGRPLRVNAGGPDTIPTLKPGPFHAWSDGRQLAFYVQQAVGGRVRNAYGDVARLRMVKSAAEVAEIRQAVAAAERAMRGAVGLVRDGVDERTVLGAFQAGCRSAGSQREGFTPIIKSGANSLWPWRILGAHYDRRNRVMRNGDLVILDVGCEVNYYTSDIGRTFPVAGRFTAPQREALTMITAVSDAVMQAIRPGVTLADLQKIAVARIPEGERKYMQTGFYFGHHIGLDAGDPSLPSSPLEPGMVFTIEPWYYNHDRDLSVFIEDNVLVTASGYELLSRGLPRSPDDLEAMVSPRR
ncbi:MAG: aminopeptidase P family protein [Gemmatimonadetes bacterium]|nr:aminopeptidase P family protein [Gemmatimonadota bacterium]